jgi:hypothetical protein
MAVVRKIAIAASTFAARSSTIRITPSEPTADPPGDRASAPGGRWWSSSAGWWSKSKLRASTPPAKNTVHAPPPLARARDGVGAVLVSS